MVGAGPDVFFLSNKLSKSKLKPELDHVAPTGTGDLDWFDVAVLLLLLPFAPIGCSKLFVVFNGCRM
jgi:hypothetical protein